MAARGSPFFDEMGWHCFPFECHVRTRLGAHWPSVLTLILRRRFPDCCLWVPPPRPAADGGNGRWCERLPPLVSAATLGCWQCWLLLPGASAASGPPLPWVPLVVVAAVWADCCWWALLLGAGAAACCSCLTLIDGQTPMNYPPLVTPNWVQGWI